MNPGPWRRSKPLLRNPRKVWAKPEAQGSRVARHEDRVRRRQDGPGRGSRGVERPRTRQRENTAPLGPWRPPTLPCRPLRGLRHRRGLPKRRASCPFMPIAPGADHAAARGMRKAERLAAPRARRAVLGGARCKEYNSHFLPTSHLSSPRPSTMSAGADELKGARSAWPFPV